MEKELVKAKICKWCKDPAAYFIRNKFYICSQNCARLLAWSQGEAKASKIYEYLGEPAPPMPETPGPVLVKEIENKL